MKNLRRRIAVITALWMFAGFVVVVNHAIPMRPGFSHR